MAAIEQASSPHPWSLSQLLNTSLRERTSSLVIEQAGGGLVGYAIFEAVLDEATLLNIAVRPEHRGLGVGRRLLAALLAALRGRGVRRCLLEVRCSNAPAIALYRRLGFVADGRRPDYYPTATGREDALLMSCLLEHVE